MKIFNEKPLSEIKQEKQKKDKDIKELKEILDALILSSLGGEKSV